MYFKDLLILGVILCTVLVERESVSSSRQGQGSLSEFSLSLQLPPPPDNSTAPTALDGPPTFTSKFSENLRGRSVGEKGRGAA